MKIEQFEGINNVLEAHRLQDGELTSATNVRVTDAKALVSREGYAKVYTGSNVHSVTSFAAGLVCMSDGDLIYLDDTFTNTTVLRSGLHKFRRMRYTTIGGELYFTNGDVAGIVNESLQARSLGTPTPPSRPVLSAGTAGSLPPGRYGVAFSAVDAAGVESGATLNEFIELTETGSITVSGFPSMSSEVASINIYATEADGDLLRRLGTVSNASSGSIVYRDQDSLGVAARSALMEQMPAGHLIAEHAGRLFVAVDNVLYFSETFRYGMTRLTHNYIMFPTRLTMLAPVQDMMFISDSERTYALNGNDPKQMSLDVKAPYPAIEGSEVFVDPSEVGDGTSQAETWLWMSRKGLCIGLQGGGFQNITSQRYRPVVAERAGAYFIERNGNAYYVCSGAKSDSGRENIYTSDEAVADIRRNGVIIT